MRFSSVFMKFSSDHDRYLVHPFQLKDFRIDTSMGEGAIIGLFFNSSTTGVVNEYPCVFNMAQGVR